MELKKLAQILFLSILILPCFSTQIHSITIELNNGSYLSGEIINYDNSQFEFKCWHNQGIIKLNWSEITRENAFQIKSSLQLSNTSAYDNADKIDAYQIYTKNGTIYKALILEKNQEQFKIKTVNGIEKLSIKDILKTEFAELHPLALYSNQEWYNEKIKVFDLQKATDNFKLGEYCLSYLKLYDKAKEHYNLAAQLSDVYKEEAQKRILKINQIYIQEKIDAIEKLLYIKDLKSVDESKKILADLKNITTLEESSVERIKEIEWKIQEIETNISNKTEQDIARKIYQQYLSNIKSLIRKICEQNMSYSDAMIYTQTILAKQAIAKICKDNNLSEEQVNSFMKEKIPQIQDSLPIREATYGDGSWIVNEDNPYSTSNMDPEEFAKYQKKYREIQNAKNKAAEKNELITADTWWKNAEVPQKEKFVEAKFIQKYMVVIEKKGKLCSLCNGEGLVNKNICKKCWGTLVETILLYK